MASLALRLPLPRRTFYDRLREVQDYHNRYLSLDVTEVRMRILHRSTAAVFCVIS